MARFSVVFGAAGVFLLVAMAAAVSEASIIVTTTTVEENTRGTGSGCSQRMMDVGKLDQCGKYLMNSVKGGRSQGSSRMTKTSELEEQKQMCCMQLENMGHECMCPGIKMMMNQPMWSMMGQMMGPMMSMAQNLPMQCKLMSEPCQMRAAVAEASTTFTTTIVEENTRGTASGCSQKIMDEGMLNQCGMYLMNNVKGGRSQGSSRMAKSSEMEEQKQMCCMQLENLGQECMCPGIKMMMNQPMWSMMGPMMSMAQNLPMQCKLMSEPCQMRAAVAEVSTMTAEENTRVTASGCSQQIMDEGKLNQCEMYLMNNVKGGRSQGSSRMAESEEQKQMCCMQLQNLGQQCMCPGIKMMMNQPMWSMMGQMMGPMMSMAQNLPMQCKLMSEPCQMRASF